MKKKNSCTIAEWHTCLLLKIILEQGGDTLLLSLGVIYKLFVLVGCVGGAGSVGPKLPAWPKVFLNNNAVKLTFKGR